MKKFQVGYVKEELDPRVKLHPWKYNIKVFNILHRIYMG